MKTLFVGQNLIHLESVDSTNSYASELLRQIQLPEGSVIYTYKQEKGRGQRGNSWESEASKNVALSLILHPSFLSAEKQFLLSKITSLALADLMAETLKCAGKPSKVSVKWPNDIYVNNQKIGGILIENILRESVIQTAVIGIGVNVNQEMFSPEINATSLKLLANKEFDLMQLIERLCEFIEARYLQLKTNKLEIIDADYRKSLYRLDEWANFSSGNQSFEGKIKGVSAIGKLQVELRSAEIKEFDLKEIVFI